MKKYLLTAIQAAITVLLLWWIFRDAEKREQMAVALESANLVWLVPGFVAAGIAFLFQTERWRLLLDVQGIAFPWWRTWRITMVGAFFNLFLLGSTGGDIVKIYYATRETTSKKSAAFLSVLVDRMMGLLALIAVSSVVCLLRLPDLLAHPETRALMVTLAIILGGSLVLVVCGFIVDRFDFADKLPRWLPMHARIVEFATAFSIYARAPRTLAATFLLSIPAHLLNFSTFYFAARAFGAFSGPWGWLDVFSVMPIIMTITSLPISLSGVGVREKLFQTVFTALFGTAASISVLISMGGFLMVVFWGLVGGAVYLLYRPSGGMHLNELREEVAAIEQRIENQA